MSVYTLTLLRGTAAQERNLRPRERNCAAIFTPFPPQKIVKSKVKYVESHGAQSQCRRVALVDGKGGKGETGRERGINGGKRRNRGKQQLTNGRCTKRPKKYQTIFSGEVIKNRPQQEELSNEDQYRSS